MKEEDAQNGSKPLFVRVPAGPLREKIEQLAKDNRRSCQNQTVVLLEKGIEALELAPD